MTSVAGQCPATQAFPGANRADRSAEADRPSRFDEVRALYEALADDFRATVERVPDEYGPIPLPELRAVLERQREWMKLVVDEAHALAWAEITG
ncbi:hypothetical protein CLV30_109178 [Haloactinopolyspora alba]|uniref:Uncharacterized protein n=1 Tax=Haloactinopolyspora alba TaxID=648780 RepID=A0A2P8E075_9ACTN|nr:hypothetical protein [Haloactinopolyspora alba]PSL02870.1 hypothetical protein CLV30_109178 [Haloactinopolyspora alba]